MSTCRRRSKGIRHALRLGDRVYIVPDMASFNALRNRAYSAKRAGDPHSIIEGTPVEVVPEALRLNGRNPA